VKPSPVGCPIHPFRPARRIIAGLRALGTTGCFSFLLLSDLTFNSLYSIIATLLIGTKEIRSSLPARPPPVSFEEGAVLTVERGGDR
jgi:hypothetical protein